MSPIPIGAPHTSEPLTLHVQIMVSKSGGTISSTVASTTTSWPVFVTVTRCVVELVILEISSVEVADASGVNVLVGNSRMAPGVRAGAAVGVGD
jgi:hypothetical protein